MWLFKYSGHQFIQSNSHKFISRRCHIIIIMPKGFTDQEKKIIKEELIEKGTEIFGTYGLKKTNIEDLTKAVGIAKGSFYSFYESKEDLFLDILKQAENKLIKEMRMLLKKMKKEPKETFKDFLRFHFKVSKENPIIQQVTDKTTRDYLIRKLQNNPKLLKLTQTYDYLPQFIEIWQKEGFLINKDSQLLAGLLKAIFTIGLEDETIEYIGRKNYPEIIEILIDIITEYMINLDSGKNPK